MGRIIPLSTFLLSLSSFWVGASTSSTVIYDVEISGERPSIAKVQIDTSNFQSFTMLPSRTLRDSTQPTLICQQDNKPDRSIEYGKEVICKRIVWELALSEVDESGMDVGLQNDSYSPADGWYVITEWNSIPRVEGQESGQICINADRNSCYELPSVDAPPLFIVWGMKVNQIDIDNVPVRLMTDQQQLLQREEEWLPVLSNQVRYLRSVFDVEEMEPWSLVWLKRDKSTGSISGAAGNRIYISNVAIENEQLVTDAIKHLLKISAHESIHFLFSIPAPLWANEALAEYYAKKSLSETSYKFADPVEYWQSIAANFPARNMGLYLANDKVTKKQNYQYYSLFYTKGVAFWAELDSELGSNGSSLDSYLSLLNMEWETELPKQFIDSITEKIGIERWLELEKQYL